MTSVMPSDAFPAGPLCVLPALPPILPECWSSLLSPAECPVFLPLYLCPYQTQSLEGPYSYFPLTVDLAS